MSRNDMNDDQTDELFLACSSLHYIDVLQVQFCCVLYCHTFPLYNWIYMNMKIVFQFGQLRQHSYLYWSRLSKQMIMAWKIQQFYLHDWASKVQYHGHYPQNDRPNCLFTIRTFYCWLRLKISHLLLFRLFRFPVASQYWRLNIHLLEIWSWKKNKSWA